MREHNNKQEFLLQLLQENIHVLNKAKKNLQYSMEKCEVSVTQLATEEVLESYDALTARFVRAVDILTQKALKNIFLLLKENPVTFIDKCNMVEKFGIIKSADVLLNMRDLRNKIAHEYFLEDVTKLFAEVLRFANTLCKLIDEINNYAKSLEAKLNKI